MAALSHGKPHFYSPSIIRSARWTENGGRTGRIECYVQKEGRVLYEREEERERKISVENSENLVQIVFWRAVAGSQRVKTAPAANAS